MPAELKNVCFSYNGKKNGEKTLNNVSLRINDGEFIGIMGRTGCGKTTLIQALAGLVVPESGQVLLDGEDINGRGYDRSILRRKVGIVFQYPEWQLFETTVQKDVEFGLKYLPLSKNEKLNRVQWALSVMDFDYDKVRGLSPLAMSGGEKRRVAIAGVLAAKPEILIFDEPVAGLDPAGRESFLKLAKSLNSSGTTVIIVSHNADALCQCAERIIVMANGSIVMNDRAEKIFADSASLEKYHLEAGFSGKMVSLLKAKGIDPGNTGIKYCEFIDAVEKLIKGGGSI